MSSSVVEVSLEPPIDLEADLSAWIQKIKSKIGGRILARLTTNTDELDRYLECVEIRQLPGAYLCCAFYQRDMNDAFTRAGVFMGAARGARAGTLLTHDDPVLKNYKKLVAGHNIPGPVVSAFYAGLADVADPRLSPNEFEAAFFEKFLSSPEVSAKRGHFYIIGLSVQNMKTYQSVVTHEIFHAQYFLEPGYREAVNRFWESSVEPKDRARIVEVIGQAYNTEQLDLVIDEFQAYLLQSQAQLDRMKEFVTRYQQPLREWLSSKGIRPLRVV